jgi:hypothetical protein
MSHMVHLDLSCGFAIDTAGLSELGTSSHVGQCGYDIDVDLFPALKSQFVFAPILAQVEVDGVVCFASCSFEGEPSLPILVEKAIPLSQRPKSKGGF